MPFGSQSYSFLLLPKLSNIKALNKAFTNITSSTRLTYRHLMFWHSYFNVEDLCCKISNKYAGDIVKTD